MPHSIPTARVWPVIHLLDLKTALANAAIADDLGCHGVFVISMDGRAGDVIPVAQAIKNAHPRLKVGVNLLSDSGVDACRGSIAAGLDATWVDDAGIRGTQSSAQAGELETIAAEHPSHEIFAGVAFKYTHPVDRDPPGAAATAVAAGLLPTTSGTATGKAADPLKTHAMRASIGFARLGLASGVTPANVADYVGSVTDFLVATGICSDFHTLDRSLAGALMQQLSQAEARLAAVE